MQYFWLLITAALAYVSGMAIVYALTGNVRHIRRYQALAIGAGLIALVVAVSQLDGWPRVLAILLVPTMLIIGYLSRTRTFLHSEDTRDLPPLTRTFDDTNATSAGFTAVIYLAHGEPVHYDPIGILNAFREADAAGMPIGPSWARPIAVSQVRKQYLHGQQSEQRNIHRRTLKALESAEQAADRPSQRYYLAFLDDEPRPEAAVIQALNDGASELVVLEVFTVDTPHSAAGRRHMTETLDGVAGAPPIRFSGALADSPALQQLHAQRAAALTPSDARAKTGVLLVALGRTATWDELFPESSAAEKRFLAGAQAALEAKGFALVRQARLHGNPEPMNMAEALTEEGAETVLYALVTESADSDLTQRTMPQSFAHAVLPDGVALVNLGGWNDDPQLVKALQDALHPNTAP